MKKIYKDLIMTDTQFNQAVKFFKNTAVSEVEKLSLEELRREVIEFRVIKDVTEYINIVRAKDDNRMVYDDLSNTYVVLPEVA